ncbi:hypothetical protein [Breoghania sp.]|nr:hypothetical protein [Breoghania sp.]
MLRRIDTLRQKIRNFDRVQRSMVITTQHALCIAIFSELNNLLSTE